MSDWINKFDERQQKEITFASVYYRNFNHGTPGHNHLVLIAKLVDIIETMAQEIDQLQSMRREEASRPIEELQ